MLREDLGQALGGVSSFRGTPGRGHFQMKVPVPARAEVALPRQRGWPAAGSCVPGGGGVGAGLDPPFPA